MSEKIQNETDQFWDWLFTQSPGYFGGGRDSLEAWLRKKLDEWAALSVHVCGYRATKTLGVHVRSGLYTLETKTVCVHCNTVLSTQNHRPALQATLEELKARVKELEHALSFGGEA